MLLKDTVPLTWDLLCLHPSWARRRDVLINPVLLIALILQPLRYPTCLQQEGRRGRMELSGSPSSMWSPVSSIMFWAAAKWKHIAGPRGSPPAPGCCSDTNPAAARRTGNLKKKKDIRAISWPFCLSQSHRFRYNPNATLLSFAVC